MNLRTKILLGYGIALLLLGGVLVLSYADLRRLGRASDAILSENYRSIRAAEHMINALERQDSGVLRYLLGDREGGVRQFEDSRGRFREWLGRAKDNVTIEGERTVLAELDSAYSDYVRAFTTILQSGTDGPGAQSVYASRLQPRFIAVRDAAGRLRELNEETMFRASDRARTISARSTLTVAGVGLLAVVAVLTFSFFLSTRLVRPIREVTAATRRVAEGDYDVEVPARTSDELGELARRFNDMAAELRSFRDMNVEQLVSEKRKSDAIVDSIDDPLVVVDSELRVTNLNRAARRLFDEGRREPVGRHFLEVVPRDDLFDHLEQTIRSGRRAEPPETEPYITLSRNGERRHFEAAVTSVRMEEGEPAGAILMLRDVTEVRELERMKSEFVATASHQLKTPLTSISMSLQLLAEHTGGELAERDRQLLRETEADVGRLQTLVEDLLHLSRLQSGQIELDFQAMEVGFMCERIAQIMGPQAEERGIALCVVVPEHMPPVRMDMTKASWVLTNLVSNAIRYSSSGDEIRVGAERLGEHVELWVSDEGPGIPTEHQGRIFDRFVRLDGEDEGREGGSGLGLAICREIVHAHGGRIWVESEPGSGSTFRFTLPVAG